MQIPSFLGLMEQSINQKNTEMHFWDRPISIVRTGVITSPIYLETYPCFSRKLPFPVPTSPDRKSTRLNSSHVKISYAVFCLKKEKKKVAPHAGPWSETVLIATPPSVNPSRLTRALG